MWTLTLVESGQLTLFLAVDSERGAEAVTLQDRGGKPESFDGDRVLCEEMEGLRSRLKQLLLWAQAREARRREQTAAHRATGGFSPGDLGVKGGQLADDDEHIEIAD